MADWPEDMRTINVKSLAKIVRALEGDLEAVKQGSPNAAASHPPSPSVSGTAGGTLTFEEWYPGALVALITNRGWEVTGTGSVADTVVNLATTWLSVMAVQGRSDEEIFAFWDGIHVLGERMREWEEKRRARNMRRIAEKTGRPEVAAGPRQLAAAPGQSRDMRVETITPEQLEAEEAAYSESMAVEG